MIWIYIFFSEIKGYLDEIISPRLVSNERFNLIKFTLNNSFGKRIQVLLWGDQIQLYIQQIQLRKIVTIDGALCKSCSLSYYKEDNHLVPFEVHIQRHTEVTFGDIFNVEAEQQAANEALPVQVDFESLSRQGDGTLVSEFIFIFQ